MNKEQLKDLALHHLNVVLSDIEHHSSGVSWIRYQEGVAVGIVETLYKAEAITEEERYDLRTEISCAVAVAFDVV